MRNDLKQIWKLLKRNWKGLLTFCILFRFLSYAVFPMLYRFLFAQVLRISGLRYLTAENIFRFLRSPAAVLAILLIGTCLAVQVLTEDLGILYIIDQSTNGHNTTLWEAMLFAGSRSLRAFRKGNRKLLLIVLILTPMYHLVTVINMIFSYSISGRILKMVRSRWYYALAAALLLLAAVWLFLRWMFVLSYYGLDGCTGSEALKKSRRLGKKSGRPLFIARLVRLQVLLSLLYFLFLFLGLAVSEICQALFRLPGSAVSTFQVLYIGFMVAGFDAFVLPCTFAAVAAKFYSAKRKIGEQIQHIDLIPDITDEKLSRRNTLIEVAFLLVCLVIGTVYLVGLSRGRFALRVEHLGTMQVTAHRGASMFAPENTMSAFRLAVEQGADWIELDVQESKDGVIFIMHDTNFLRTAGVDKGAWELDWEEISKLDVGSFFSPQFAGEPVPLLSEALEFAKETGIRLNIELKPSGHEKNLAGGVMDVVEAYDFEDQCVITSQSYDVIRKVRERNETIETVYVMGLAYGAINRLSEADAFSIRSTSISRSLVHDLHNRGHQVYAWTVDSRQNISRMINLEVDNIITNNIPLAIEIINESRTNGMITDLLHRIRDFF